MLFVDLEKIFDQIPRKNSMLKPEEKVSNGKVNNKAYL